MLRKLLATAAIGLTLISGLGLAACRPHHPAVAAWHVAQLRHLHDGRIAYRDDGGLWWWMVMTSQQNASQSYGLGTGWQRGQAPTTDELNGATLTEASIPIAAGGEPVNSTAVAGDEGAVEGAGGVSAANSAPGASTPAVDSGAADSGGGGGGGGGD